MRRPALPPGEITVVHRLRVTTVERTLLDMASRLGARAYEGLVAACLQQRRTGLDKLSALDHRRTVEGRRLLELVGELGTGPQSGFELAIARWLAELGVPTPECNGAVATPVGELHPDFLWRSAGVALEAQGRAFHLEPAEWERDLERKAALAAVGIQVVELSWRQFSCPPDRARFARHLTAALACRQRGGAGAAAQP
ncbi:MAG: hypothetical protein ACYDAQ_01980 [Mycobacteriales bacterium]